MRTYACTRIRRNVSTIPLACADMTPLGIHILHNNSNEMQGPGANNRTGDDLRATTFRNKHPMRGYPQEVLLGFTRAPIQQHMDADSFPLVLFLFLHAEIQRRIPICRGCECDITASGRGKLSPGL